jgi:hypothetical protein
MVCTRASRMAMGGQVTRRSARLQPQQGSLIGGPEVMTVEQWRKETKVSKSDQLHDNFASQLRMYGLPAPVTEHLFAKEAIGRRWKFDFCWPAFMVAVELEGLVMRQLYDAPRPGANRVLVSYGRHTTITGFCEDSEKYGNAAILGWTVMRFAQPQVRDKTAVEMTVRLLAARGWKP